MLKRRLSFLLVLLLVFVAAAGCGRGGNTTVVLTTGFSKNEVFRIENSSCSLSEIMVYLTNTQNQYESVYGSRIWETQLNGVSLEENVKDTVLARIARIKTMNLLAEKNNVTLSEEEKNLVTAAATEYFGSLNDTEKEVLNVEMKDIEKMYSEYALAEKVYRHIISGINPEISDDEARIILVQQIMIKTYTTDGAGIKVPYSTKAKAEAFEKAQQILTLAKDGEHDFETLAAQYSEDNEITYSFGKGEMDPSFEEAAFNLGTGEISSIVESEYGYHIIKCLNTFNQEQTDANKLKIMEERKQEVFGQEYDAFVETLTRNLNTKLWDKVSLIHDDNVTTNTFFSVYLNYFEEYEETN